MAFLLLAYSMLSYPFHSPEPTPTPTPAPSTSPPQPAPPSPVASPPPTPQGPTADEIKEEGNTAFKTKQYNDAIELYTKAIGNDTALLLGITLTLIRHTDMKPTEPSYLTNRAAAYIALKRFRPALTDCQHAAALQSENPSSKTLSRLARCQLALGESKLAATTLQTILSLEPSNSTALQLQTKVCELEAHLRNFENAKQKKDWAMSRLALDKCLQSIESEEGEVPIQWRLWRVELELGRANWDAANIAAK